MKIKYTSSNMFTVESLNKKGGPMTWFDSDELRENIENLMKKYGLTTLSVSDQ